MAAEREMDGGIGPARALVRDLRDLGGVAVPRALLPNVLALAGLVDAYWSLETAIGPAFVAYNDAGIAAVMRGDDAAAFEEAFRARFGRPVRAGAVPPALLARAVARQLHGGKGAAARFDLRGRCPFERAVLEQTLRIPRGEVRPYAWIAREIGRPGAVRAVGSALGRNPIPLLIPCHRVVRSDGASGDYVFGDAAKRAALGAEGVEPDALAALGRAGVRYLGSDTTRVYCFPTCRNARRITPPHRVPFGSDASAVAAGYRPCRVCRPA